jgi:uncharacterized lipoprotein YajG
MLRRIAGVVLLSALAALAGCSTHTHKTVVVPPGSTVVVPPS